MGKNKIVTHLYESPCGMLMIGAYDNALCLCDWQIEGHSNHINSRLKRLLNANFVFGESATIDSAIHQLDEYFAGERTAFDIPLLFAGTDFQKLVWRYLLDIPYGKTISYSEMAERTGKPRAVRAVANANASNAISIFAPCHRVIGSNNTLTGYGGGVETKRRLLRLEGITIDK